MITVVSGEGTGTTTASVTVTTALPTSTYVEYGITTGYGETTTDSLANISHAFTISNLEPSTTYHYRVHASDSSGSIVSSDQTFTTSAAIVPTVPEIPTVTVTVPDTVNVNTGTVNTSVSAVITNIEVTAVTASTATINWTTDIPSDSQVEYGVSDILGTETSSTALVTNHSILISNLTPDTNYIFRVKSKPLGTNVSTVSTLHDFSTLITPIFVTTPANITSISSSNVLATSANVSWTTDIATTGHVEYGITTEYGQTGLSSGDQTSHSVSLADLAPDTTYHYRVKALNTAGDITYSDDHTFTTPISILNVVTPPTTPTTPSITPTNPEAVSAPSLITNLSISGHDETSAVLSWNAVSADSDAGMFTDVRFSTSPITESNFSSATSAQVTPIVYPELAPSGIARMYLVAGLAPNTTHYFAIKQKYEASDWSGVSNVVTVTTLASVPVDTSPITSNTPIVDVPHTDSNDLLISPETGTVIPTISAPSSSETIPPETTTSLPIEHPTFINGSPEDSQIVFTWDNPSEADFVRTIIVRKVGSYPTSPTDGTTIYESDGETFTDTNVTNGTMYYYAFYSYDHARTYSEPVRVSLAPVAAVVLSRAGSGGSSNTSSAGGSVGQVIFHETPVIVPSDVAEHFTTVWKKGDSHIEIEHIQHVLANDGEFYPNEKIDGKFGAITEKGLKAFQAKYNLPVTGVTDQPTQKQLNIASQSLVSLAVPDDVAVLETNMKQGDKSPAVEDLQQLLADEGSYRGVIDGQFGSQTHAAVHTFQNKYFISPSDGVVGPKTRHMLKVLTGL